MKLKKIAPILVGAVLIIFMTFSSYNSATWPAMKMMPSSDITTTSFGKNISYEQAELLIGIWLGLILLGGFLLAHIHLRTLKEQAR